MNHHLALYEAIYLHHKMKFEQITNANVLQAMNRMLYNEGLLELHHGQYAIKNEDKYEALLNCALNQDIDYLEQVYQKACLTNHFFFDHLDQNEYEIYSRTNFPVTYHLGKIIRNHICLKDLNILEIGGNSGGLGTAFSDQCYDSYTIVDQRIPCQVGNAYKALHDVNLDFVEGDMFELSLNKSFDVVILMNIIHDFNDEKSLEILANCLKYTHHKSQIVIIEDLLESEYEPKAAIIHGLRLAIACSGGKQRTYSEMNQLLNLIGLSLKSNIKIDEVHTMAVYERINFGSDD